MIILVSNFKVDGILLHLDMQFANLTSISPFTRFYNYDMQHCNFQNNNLAGVAFVNCDLGNADFF